MNLLTHLDLFSGIGGFALAARWTGFRTVGFCEIEPYAQRVIIKNFGAVMADASRTDVSERSVKSDQKRRKMVSQIRSSNELRPETGGDCGPIIHPDIFKFDGRQYAGVTLITGGFPCQPFSCAGKRRGKEDDRHLWPEMRRVISEARPTWVIGENVAGIIGMELDTVLSDLEVLGYACQTLVIPAVAVDARHRRDRVWIVANSECGGQPRQRKLVNAIRSTTKTHEKAIKPFNGSEYYEWFTEPDVGRVANGVPHRMERLRGLGNAIVPQVAAVIMQEIANLIINDECQFTRGDGAGGGSVPVIHRHTAPTAPRVSDL